MIEHAHNQYARINSAIFIFLFSFTLIHSQTPEFLWVEQEGGSNWDRVFGFISDHQGNIILGGDTYSSPSEFGSTLIYPIGSNAAGSPLDAYVAKYDQQGQLIWIHHTGGQCQPQKNCSNRTFDVDIDPNNNILAAGFYGGSATAFGSHLLPSPVSGQNGFVVKYRDDGLVLWARSITGFYPKFVQGICSDNQGNVYVTGNFAHQTLNGDATFDGIFLNTAGGTDIFVAKYNSNGQIQWANRAGSSINFSGADYIGDVGKGIVCDETGNIYVMGHFAGTADFGSKTISSHGDRDVFVAKYNPSGDVLWVRALGGVDEDDGQGIKMASDGKILITGIFEGEAHFGPYTIQSSGGHDVFLAKMSQSGDILWVRHGGGTSTVRKADLSYGLDDGHAGNIYISGVITGAATFDGITINSIGDSDSFIAKYSTDGNIQWVKRTGGDESSLDGSNVGLGTFVTSFGVDNVYVAGQFQGTANFDQFEFESYGLTDIFLGKLGTPCYPDIICPFSDQTVVAVDQNCQVSLPDYRSEVTFDANCTPESTPTILQYPLPGTLIGGNGTIQEVTLSADWGNGNITSCTFNLIVEDHEDPSIICPDGSITPFNLASDANCDAVLPDYSNEATVTDNCTESAAITLSQNPQPGTVLNGDGTSQLVTLTADDGNGNTSTCSFTVTVQDQTDPLIVCPDGSITPFTLASDANCNAVLPDYTNEATVTDNCTESAAITVSQNPPPGTVLNGHGTSQLVTLTADDGNGNTITCSCTVTVQDQTDPLIVCPDGSITPFTLASDANCNAVLPDYTNEATVTDNCTESAAITILQNPPPGTILNGHGTSQLVTLTADDGNGNSITCSFTVTVQDQTDPLIVCPDGSITPFNLASDSNCDAVLPDYTIEATVTDNCTESAAITILQNPPPGTILNGHGTSQLVTLTADDGNGNSITCSFTVTVQDQTDPLIVCPDGSNIPFNLASDANCDALLPDYTNEATVIDNCTESAAITILQNPPPGTVLNGHGTSQLVTLTADDGNGNTITCSFTVTVQDQTDPLIACPDGSITPFTLASDAYCDAVLPDYSHEATVTDNCTESAAITISQNPPTGTVLNGHGTSQLVTLIADDGNGNSITCSFTVTVQDQADPLIVCPDGSNIPFNLPSDANCDAVLPDYTNEATVTDNCTESAAITVSQNPPPGTVLNGHGTSQLVTLTADDGNGNTITCSFTMTVQDQTDPLIVCPDGSITPFNLASDANCDAVLPDYTIEATVTDNCTESAAITISQNPPPGTVLNGHGTSQLVTLTADDGNGNTATCSFTVTVQDQTDPLIVCPSNISVTSDPGTCTAVVNFADPLVTDNCAIDYVVCVPSSGSTFPLGTTTVTCTASDINGNSSQCTFDVIVEDIEGPTIAEIKVPIDPIPLGSPISTVAYFENCNDISEAYWDWGDDSTSPGNIFDDSISGSHIFDSVGVFRVSVTMIDSYGNVASETAIAYIVIYDPSAGFVTGSGWIESPPGAYLIDETITGKAHFGFVSRYQSGANIPTGRTDFRFKAADLLFEGVAFEWLVVAGANTKFKGTGTINGSGNYGFMLTATDGSINGGGGLDKFRIKIWDIDADETVVYDNKLGSDDIGYNAQEIGAGAIKIHKTNGNNNRMQFTTRLISSEIKLSAYPNPFQQELEIDFTLAKGNWVNLSVYDINGRHIKTLVNEIRSLGLHTEQWNGHDEAGKLVSSGVYLIRYSTEAEIKITTVIFQK